MREIKFRAYDKDGKEMFRVFMLTYVEGKGLIASGKGGSASIDDSTILMQYTGLKDKNGKEIYEGDVLRWRRHPNPMQIGEVEYSAAYGRFQIKYTPDELHRERGYHGIHGFGSLNHMEVIGNIYENPDLLTPQEQLGKGDNNY